MISTMNILHVFSPNYKVRFGGQVFLWKKLFYDWREDHIQHYVYDYERQDMKEATTAFQFSYPEIQISYSKIKSAVMYIRLFGYLIKNTDEFDILHVHVLRWGGLFLGYITKIFKLSSIYESVLYSYDHPSAITKQKLGRVKVALLRGYTSILAISSPLAIDYKSHNFNVFRLINPVESRIFHPVDLINEKEDLRCQLGIPKDAFVWLNVGSVRHRKGTDILIAGFIEHCKVKNPKSYLVIVGPQNTNENPSIDEQFVENLKSQLIAEGLLESVKFVGLIQDPLFLAKYYQAADVFVFPSRQEGLGNVVLEAMASSLPVVVSNLPVLENVIDDKRSGVVIQITNASNISDAIKYIEDNDIAAQELGNEARKKVLSDNDVGVWQKRLGDIYQQLVAIN